MKSRHRAREVALQILYRMDVGTPAPTAGPIPVGGPLTPSSDPAKLIRELQQHFDHFKVDPDLREFAAELVAGTLREQKRLDELLENHASNWKVSRMGVVDRSLLRMALYELLHFQETPASVVIDEAIELGKQFGTADTPSFVNGILDAVKKASLPRS